LTGAFIIRFIVSVVSRFKGGEYIFRGERFVSVMLKTTFPRSW